MTEEEIQQVESKLNVILPKAFKTLLKNYPLNDCSANFQKSIINNAVDLININQRLRENGYKGKKLPEGFFAIGTNWRSINDILFIDIPKENEIVYFFPDDKNINIRKIDNYLFAKSFDEFIEKIKLFADLSGELKK